MNHTVLMIVATLLAGLSPLVTLASDAFLPQFLGPGSRRFRPTPICRIAGPPRKTSPERRRFRDGAGRRPLCVDDRVFLTTVVGQGDSEMPKKGLYRGGERRNAAPRNTNGKCCAWTCSPATCFGNGLCIAGRRRGRLTPEQLRLGDAGHGWPTGVRLLRERGRVLP